VAIATELQVSDTGLAHGAVRPRFGKVPTAVRYSAVSRSVLYELAAVYPGLFRKNGAATLVDFDVLDRILDALPVAEIRPKRRTFAAAPST
jgi:hypothetical protein